ncbi:helix-turn-helix domain-containing protein [Faucicola atlantae]|uniref:helix-turn-helix domain-containing protein n=1 Tax=Faucicola atlantae TaxID=34059 RepID=UPI0025AFEECD|nr:helix-turn-helix domain-containing protein [Moraxella atlantae]
MPKIYDQDLRDKAISHWQKTGNKSKTARLFEINRNTLDEWIKLYQEQGNTKPKPFAPVGVKHIITDLTNLENYVKSQEFDTAKQLREQYLKDHPDVDISYNAFLETLRRIKWTFKKRPLYLNKPTQ